MKYYSSKDSGTEDKRKEFTEKAGKDALKEAKEKALTDILANAKPDNVAELEKAITQAKAAAEAAKGEIKTEEAEAKLAKLKEAKEAHDKGVADKQAAAD